MRIIIQKEQKTIERVCRGTARELLRALDINPEVVLIVKDGQLITLDDDIDDAKVIELLSVVSGG